MIQPTNQNQPASLNQETSGQGDPLVVLHGLFGDADNFRSIAIHLERYFQVIRVDLPGHGKSSTLPTLSIQALAEAVSSHLVSTGVSRFHLLGHSLGGKVAMQMAGNKFEKNGLTLDIGKLVVVDIAPRLYPPHHTDILDALSNLSLSKVKKRADADKQLREQIPDAGVRGFLLKSLFKNAGNEYQWRFDLNGIQSSYEAMRQPPTFDHSVVSPTLFIKGGNSDYLGAEDETPIRNHFSDPHFKEIVGTGHWPHAEKPALFTRICLEFLQLNQPNNNA